MRRSTLFIIPAIAFCLLYAASTAQADLLALEYFSFKIFRFDETTGAPLGVFADLSPAVHQSPDDMAMGPDGNLYVGDFSNGRILRYNGRSGAFIDVFTKAAATPGKITFDAAGNLFTSGWDSIEKYDGVTGSHLGTVVPWQNQIGYRRIRIGPDGLLYAVKHQGNSSDIVRFDPNTGSLIDTFIAGRFFDGPTDFTFGPSGEMYISNWHRTELIRYDGGQPTSIESLSSMIDDTPSVNPDLVTYSSDGALFVEHTGNDFSQWQIKKYDATTGDLIADFPKGVFVAFAISQVPEPMGLGIAATAFFVLVVARCRRP